METEHQELRLPGPASSLAHIRQLCSLDVDSRTAMPAILAALKSWLGFAVGAFFWADDQGRPVAACASDPAAQRLAGHYAAEYAQSVATWPSLIELALRRRTGVVDFSPYEREFLRSNVCRELLAPAGLDRQISGSVVSPAGALGVLLLFRGGHERVFCREYRRRLALALPEIANVLDRRAGDHTFVTEGDSGMVIAGFDGDLRHACVRGRELLHMAACPRQFHLGALVEPERQLLARLAVDVGNDYDGHAWQGPAVAIDNVWGRFQLRAARLHGGTGTGDQVGIRIQRQVPAALKMVQTVDGLGLSPRQRELAVLLGCSLQNEIIADRLGLRPSTVAGMVKDVYHRVGVNSRQALREMLLQPA
jgi:DNA-binding CsgD family transcriptional regulator